MHHQTCINESIPICLDRVHTKRPFAKCAGHYNLKTNKQSGHQDWCIHSYHDISVHTLLAITQHVEQQASCACSLLASKNDASVLVVVVDHRAFVCGATYLCSVEPGIYRLNQPKQEKVHVS